MLSLSPAKLLVVLVVALIVLGPDKLPRLARQMGALWGDLRKWRARLEEEVRTSFPDLPSAHEVAQAVRSPLTFLDRLADEHDQDRTLDPSAATQAAAHGALEAPATDASSDGHAQAALDGATGVAAVSRPERVEDADAGPSPANVNANAPAGNESSGNGSLHHDGARDAAGAHRVVAQSGGFEGFDADPVEGHDDPSMN